MNMPIESFNLLVLNVGYARHNADWNWKGVKSPFARLYCVTEGEAHVTIDGTIYELTPGHLYMIPPGVMHDCECTGVFSHYYVHFFEGFNQEKSLFDQFHFPFEVSGREGDAMLLAEICQQYPDAKLPASDPQSYDNKTMTNSYTQRYADLSLSDKMSLRGGMLYMLSRFVKDATPVNLVEDARLCSVLDYIHQNICHDITIDSLADVACMSKSYLIRSFCKEMGMPPLQYINKKKISQAQLLLLTTDMSVKEIAYTLGFSNNSYFVRLFRHMTGTTPLTYRHQNQ